MLQRALLPLTMMKVAYEAKQEEEHHGMEKQSERMARSTVFAEDAARAFHALLECANGPKATIRLTQNVAWGHISCVLRN